MDASRDVLIENGIWLCQYPVPLEQSNSLGLVTKLTHAESGQWQGSLAVVPLLKSRKWKPYSSWCIGSLALVTGGNTVNYRFHMSVAAVRTTLDKNALREELSEIFRFEYLGDIGMDALLAGEPFEKK